MGARKVAGSITAAAHADAAPPVAHLTSDGQPERLPRTIGVGEHDDRVAVGGDKRAHTAVSGRPSYRMEQFVTIGLVRPRLENNDTVWSFEVVAERLGSGDGAGLVGTGEEIVDEIAT